MSRHLHTPRGTRSRKAMAITSAAAVLGAGTLFTLASWSESEWVFGGLGGNPNVGTSEFAVWQNRAVDAPASDSTGWDDQHTNPGGELQFTAGSLTLTPGDSIYAPVAIQTKADSIAGELTLQAPVPAILTPAPDPNPDPDDLLWNALQFSVRVTETQPTAGCTADTWATFGGEVVTDESFNATFPPGTPDPQDVEANRGNVQYYCFQITLPANPTLPDGTDINELQGRSVAPAWEFIAESTSE